MKKSIYSHDNQKLIDLLKESRKSAGYTLRDIAKKTNLHHSIIGKIETGDRRLDVIEFLEYCKILDIDPHFIISEILKAQLKE